MSSDFPNLLAVGMPPSPPESSADLEEERENDSSRINLQDGQEEQQQNHSGDADLQFQSRAESTNNDNKEEKNLQTEESSDKPTTHTMPRVTNNGSDLNRVTTNSVEAVPDCTTCTDHSDSKGNSSIKVEAQTNTGKKDNEEKTLQLQATDESSEPLVQEVPERPTQQMTVKDDAVASAKEETTNEAVNASTALLQLGAHHNGDLRYRVESAGSLSMSPRIPSSDGAETHQALALPSPAIPHRDESNLSPANFHPRGGAVPVLPSMGYPQHQYVHHQQHPHVQQMLQHQQVFPVPTQIPQQVSKSSGGRRSIRFHLEEEKARPRHGRNTSRSRSSFFFRSGRALLDEHEDSGNYSKSPEMKDRGALVVSWYEGTTSAELQEHVKRSVIRKLNLKGSNTRLGDLRIIDQSVVPQEEIVLNPFIPDGSEFLLQFTTREQSAPKEPAQNPYASKPPDSPSKAPSPNPWGSNTKHLSEAQLQILSGSLLHRNSRSVKVPLSGASAAMALPVTAEGTEETSDSKKDGNPEASSANSKLVSRSSAPLSPKQLATNGDLNSDDDNYDSDYSDSDDLVAERLRQLNEILSTQRGKRSGKRRDQQQQEFRKAEKRQVVFVISNYLVLFLSFIAISAEIQARTPQWGQWVESQLESVQNCAKDRDALIECVEKGDVYGLIASIILWITRSALTKQIFLFGFESTAKLWTVVYEAAVTAVSWGISYTFIRRGLNPDTRENFLQKYWKDALYGSLAGFNAAFMKAVLKNLIPQHVLGEALESALDNRQLKIVNWFNQHFGAK